MNAISILFATEVSSSFTMSSYSKQMVDRLQLCARLVACAVAILFGVGTLASGEARGQTADIDWEDAGIASQGSLPTGTTATGSDGTIATITWSSDTTGTGSFDPGFSPTFVSYFSGTIGGAVSPLLVSFDNSSFDPGDKITIDITLTRSVTNLNFSLGDIDFDSFADAVEVAFDDDSSGAFANVAINNAFWTIGSSVARTNDAVVDGWRGTAGSPTAATDGNINFNFGAQSVQRIRIVYFSHTGTGDPVPQFLGISDFSFDPPQADLSLSKSLIGSVPTQGGMATWNLTVTNASNSQLTADSIVVEDTFPSGFSFSNASGDGTINSGNGQWSVGTLAPGESASLTISGTIIAAGGTTITNVAEIISSSAVDLDSTPNNGVATEDDFSSSSFIVAGSPTDPPVLSCPAGQSVFDWDSPSVSWSGGSTDNTYPLASFGDIRFEIMGDGRFVSRGSFGGAVPRLTTAVRGGLNPAELALAYNANNANRSEQFVTTVTLPRVFTGAQFTIFDIDQSSRFQDRVTVYGELNGVRVDAILTAGLRNSVSGDTFLGTGGAGDATDDGNGTITFVNPIDTIVFEYGNGPSAPANPGNQSIALHDITLCIPLEPLISVSKVSSIVADPVNGNTNPKAIPGATVEYLITVSNMGNGAPDADSVVVWDNGPADAKMCLIARSGGPVIFGDPGNNSGLSYDYGGAGSVVGDLAVGSDDLEFSENDGASFDYIPTADGDGCDTDITDFRVRPSGAFATGGNFTITVRYQVE